ncbi:hypothetical protein EYF80_002564 [Liparis tanakae]|uniref:Uncharacterized protein n=1 Tax=Liparis tanakae TaxID=230148 RepID=A0A4Z2JC69_9TELE|nr:hypothetical protein EYF80_002564 [Liparis tanakae]
MRQRLADLRPPDSAQTSQNAPQQKDAAGGHLPRRRWSRRIAGNEVLEVKSMLDLRLLDLDCPDRQAELRAEPEVKTCLVDVSLHRTNQELGSSISLQVNTEWVRIRSGGEPRHLRTVSE